MRLGNVRVKLTKRFSAQLTDKTAKALKLRFAAVCFRAVYKVDRYFFGRPFCPFSQGTKPQAPRGSYLCNQPPFWSSRPYKAT